MRRTNYFRSLTLLAAVTGLAVTLMACGGSSGKKEPTPTAGPVELTAAQILEKDKTSIVSVVTNTPYGEGGGTGIVFEDSSHVLTNAH
ncbi:MAG TPA: hypothetical protein VFX19_08770, partial [Dehalococcoidia bacterium]|nr:hypothetical protein [Dehalococcoidia bacterium]